MREAVNTAGVQLVSAGFDAIDQLAARGKLELKKAILRGIAGPRKS